MARPTWDTISCPTNQEPESHTLWEPCDNGLEQRQGESLGLESRDPLGSLETEAREKAIGCLGTHRCKSSGNRYTDCRLMPAEIILTGFRVVSVPRSPISPSGLVCEKQAYGGPSLASRGAIGCRSHTTSTATPTSYELEPPRCPRSTRPPPHLYDPACPLNKLVLHQALAEARRTDAGAAQQLINTQGKRAQEMRSASSGKRPCAGCRIRQSHGEAVYRSGGGGI